MNRKPDRRIKTSCYVGMCICPNCGAHGSIFEVYRMTRSVGRWRLHEYRVMHDRASHFDPCLNIGHPVQTYCRLSPRMPFEFWFGSRNSELGGGFMKRSMIRHNETDLEATWEREISPVRQFSATTTLRGKCSCQ